MKAAKKPPKSPSGWTRWAAVLALLACVGAIAYFNADWGPGRTAKPAADEARAGDVAVEKFPDGSPRRRREFQAVAQSLYRDGDPDYFPQRRVEELKAQLAQPGLGVPQRAEILGHLARSSAILGATDQAVAAIEQAFSLAEGLPGGLDSAPDYHWLRGVVYLRRAEEQNCIKRRNRDCCVFPLQGGGVHSVRDPAERAKASYLKYLQLKPADSLRARWMLNILAMALGEYPQGLPPSVAIPPAAFDSEYDIKRFIDIAPVLGVDTFNLAGGVICEDIDNDGLLDIVTSTLDPIGPLHYYRNSGRGAFEDRSEVSRLDDQLGGLNCIGADYDDDGDIDILVLRGGWWQEHGRIRNSLLRHNSDGTFTDVTLEAGLAHPPMPTQTAAWFDMDHDGDLDLFVGNESGAGLGIRELNHPSQLFRNNGDGTFTDVARQAGVTNDRYCKGVAAGDYDNDGDIDLYLSNLEQNRLYRNNGDGTFTDVAQQLGVTAPDGRSFAAWFFDYNNDGWLDIFCAAYDATIADLCADALQQPFKASPPALYRNDHGRGFTNVAADMGLRHPYLPMGANFGDLDNDGWLDMYLGTGDPHYESLMPNVMLRNDQGLRFQNVTRAGGFGYLQKGHGIGFADFDHDGDQDVYHQLGGQYPGDSFHNVFLLNPGHGNRFIALELQGVQANRMAIGARVKVTVQTANGVREIHRAVGSVSSFGGSPIRRLEIGLGPASAINEIEIRWPGSERRQRFQNVELDAAYRVLEGSETLEPIERPRVVFDAAGSG